VQHRAYKFRIYPSAEQQDALARVFGSCRFVYNWALAFRRDKWVKSKLSTSYLATSKALTELKAQEDYAWLNETSSVCLQQALRNLDVAFSNFFKKKKGYPKFKSRKSGFASARFQSNGFVLKDGSLFLAKMKSPIEVRWSRELPPAPSSVSISKNAAGQWFASFVCEVEIPAHPKSESSIGVDLGIETFATLSDGRKVNLPKSIKNGRKTIAKLSKSLSRKKTGSKNREKARVKLARAHEKISNIRKDFLHKFSSQLVRENQVIALEDLHVQEMNKDRRLARCINEQGWREFRTMIEYKCEWYGRENLVVDRYFPSSKTCSACGKVSKFGLKVRKWSCACGATHDRDVNAAKNILSAGHVGIKDCGVDGRPTKNYVIRGSLRRNSKITK
jgi:putative transposase